MQDVFKTAAFANIALAGVEALSGLEEPTLQNILSADVSHVGPVQFSETPQPGPDWLARSVADGVHGIQEAYSAVIPEAPAALQ
jgi:hypothetical protein